jgi:hypothetical protein
MLEYFGPPTWPLVTTWVSKAEAVAAIKATTSDVEKNMFKTSDDIRWLVFFVSPMILEV